MSLQGPLPESLPGFKVTPPSRSDPTVPPFPVGAMATVPGYTPVPWPVLNPSLFVPGFELDGSAY